MHQGQPLLKAGEPLAGARAAVVMLHGRGAAADDMIGLAAAIGETGVTYLAPQAAGCTWYPNRFTAPIASNEPWLSSALQRVDEVLAFVFEAGLHHEQIVLLGFSQGACLALEYAARHARRYGGVAGLSGGLIGPVIARETYAGTFDGTPVFLGCSDVDPHIPAARVHETAQVMTTLGASVTTRIYPGMGHTVNEDEVGHVRGLLERIVHEYREI